MFKTYTFARPIVAVLVVSFSMIAFSFWGCKKTPGPSIPDPRPEWLLSKITSETGDGDVYIYEYKYNSFNKPFLRKTKFNYEGKPRVDSIEFVYDGQQRLIAIKGGIDVITYDAEGRIKTIGAESGKYPTTYEYFDNNTKVKSIDYWRSQITPENDTLAETHTYIYDQGGRLVEDTFIYPLIATGVFEGYDTAVTRYTQFDQHPNPAALTNTDVSMFILPDIARDPFITPNNYQKKREENFAGDLLDTHVYIRSTTSFFSYEYNQAGLVKSSTVKTIIESASGDTSATTEVVKYEYIKAGD